MSRERCPDCNSSDGLAEYVDGTHCHSCKTNRKNKSLLQEEKPVKSNDIKGDLFPQLPPWANEFLTQYDISDKIVHLPCKLSYACHYDRICFEYQGCYALRSLGLQPKWLYKGRKKSDVNFIFFRCADMRSGDVAFSYTKDLVIVEDIMSAIKVQQVSDVICLNGTSLTDKNKEFLLEHGDKYQRIILFLDGDKAGKIAKEKLRKELKLCYTVCIVRNKQDPKGYSRAELEEILK